MELQKLTKAITCSRRNLEGDVVNRAERRRQERDLKKDLGTIQQLTPQQTKLINIAATEKAKVMTKKYIDNFSRIADRAIRAALIDEGYTTDEVYRLEVKITELMEEDNRKIIKLEKENVDMAKIDKEVRKYIEELLKKGVSKKQVINDLVFTFPKLSKSVLLNIYTEVKKEKGYTENRVSREEVYEYFNSHLKSWNGEEMIKHAIKEFGFTESTAQTYYYKWKKEFMDNRITKIEKTDKKQTQEKSKKIQNKEDTKVEGLKVLEKKVIKTVKVEGKNGI
ncbi:hypothetical protein FDA77_19055 [Clostridium botulinum]|uniref:hypothetical protein n=1 Tax=Clostridium botulinum TaxID=1491 RepID=UPI0013FA92CC|nr:hypothetical protein [Clostridium botulinum]MBY6888787.1 hypothetical protein [Clostridium botulinum]NFI47921.1 hypothetical protein [Clostridium botulinum]NFJ91928.1 hypothetical protein [Clostridium botulinum]HBJ2609698.1 hypothetical protein [Clostridium botulinum]HDI3120727.1 hypothetical protein [Clostridium botulinum]